MATVNLTIPTRGNHPRGRKPYQIQNTIDLAVATSSKGTALAASDVYQCLNIPAESVILHAGMEVTTALTGTSSDTAFDLGITGSTAGHNDPDCWVDAYDATGAGHAPMDATDAAAMLVCKVADTIDILTAGAQDTAGKVRVWALLCDISGVYETASNTA